jgi:excisionase family DNA binding protein
MMRKRRTEITIETERVVIVRRRLTVRVWCRSCDRQVTMVTVDEAARMAGVSSRTIYRWVEADQLHFNETAEGRLLICTDSLLTVGSG